MFDDLFIFGDFYLGVWVVFVLFGGSDGDGGVFDYWVSMERIFSRAGRFFYWRYCWCWWVVGVDDVIVDVGDYMMNLLIMKSFLKYIYLSIDGYRYRVVLLC